MRPPERFKYVTRLLLESWQASTTPRAVEPTPAKRALFGAYRAVTPAFARCHNLGQASVYRKLHVPNHVFFDVRLFAAVRGKGMEKLSPMLRAHFRDGIRAISSCTTKMWLCMRTLSTFYLCAQSFCRRSMHTYSNHGSPMATMYSAASSPGRKRQTTGGINACICLPRPHTRAPHHTLVLEEVSTRSAFPPNTVSGCAWAFWRQCTTNSSQLLQVNQPSVGTSELHGLLCTLSLFSRDKNIGVQVSSWCDRTLSSLPPSHRLATPMRSRTLVISPYFGLRAGLRLLSLGLGRS